MKYLIAATLLMTASFAQADSVYIEITSDKVAACKLQLKHNLPVISDDKCKNWYEWKNSKRGDKMWKEHLNSTGKSTATDKRRLEQIVNDSEYVDNF